MPKTPSTKTPVRKDSQLFVLKHAQKRVLVQRPKSYKLAIDAACMHFPCLTRTSIVLQTKDLEVCDGHYVDITDESWAVAMDLIASVEIIEALPQRPLPMKAELITDTFKTVPAKAARINITLCFSEWPNIVIGASGSTLIRHLLGAAARTLGKKPEVFRPFFKGSVISLEATVASCELEDGDVIDVMVEQVGGKPVIYLYSPYNIDVSVKLSLTPGWRFSAVYPVVPTKNIHSEHIEWNVCTHQDGSLTEKITGLNVSYLFWEAETDHSVPPSPPPSPVLGQSEGTEHFSPVSSDLCDADSVLLPVVNITPYLDKALQALGLHTEARTSFITYWLPSMLKHKYVALRFLPQVSYERAAPLDISPKPDITTRIFMLFKGVSEQRLVDWSGAQSRAEEDVVWWRHVVGVNITKVGDADLFRVLEWGGMEVLRGSRWRNLI